jgi:hypothetical protein
MSVERKAQSIAGKTLYSGDPDPLNPCYGALGYGGKGRVMVIGSLDIWRSGGC